MKDKRNDRVRFWTELWFLLFAASALAVFALLAGGGR